MHLHILRNPDNIPGAVSSGYQRQNTNIGAIQTGIDTTAPTDNNAGTITIPRGGIVDCNGTMFAVSNVVTLQKPVHSRAYFIGVTDLGNGNARFDLRESPGTWNSDHNGFYAGGQRVLNWVSLGVPLGARNTHVATLTNGGTVQFGKCFLFLEMRGGHGGHGGHGGSSGTFFEQRRESGYLGDNPLRPGDITNPAISGTSGSSGSAGQYLELCFYCDNYKLQAVGGRDGASGDNGGSGANGTVSTPGAGGGGHGGAASDGEDMKLYANGELIAHAYGGEAGHPGIGAGFRQGLGLVHVGFDSSGLGVYSYHYFIPASGANGTHRTGQFSGGQSGYIHLWRL